MEDTLRGKSILVLGGKHSLKSRINGNKVKNKTVADCFRFFHCIKIFFRTLEKGGSAPLEYHMMIITKTLLILNFYYMFLQINLYIGWFFLFCRWCQGIVPYFAIKQVTLKQNFSKIWSLHYIISSL